MPQKRTIFIIPGYKHSPNHAAYKKIVKLLTKEKYNPICIKIQWDKKTLSQNTKYFLDEYTKLQHTRKYILGFSYGAVIAFLASTKVRPDGVILCSLSPYFKEDRPRSPFRASTLSKKIKTNKILFLYGTQEDRTVIRRVRQTYKHSEIPEKYLLPVLGSGHFVGSKKYLQAIQQATTFL